VTPEQLQAVSGFIAKLSEYATDFKGPVPVDQAIRQLRSIFDMVSIEGGYGGAFISHFGNKQWV
jgi:hypothetical protein